MTAGPAVHRVRAIGPRDQTAVRAHLMAGMPLDAFLLDALIGGGFAGFLGAFAGDELAGVVFVRSGAICASSRTPAEVAPAFVGEIKRRGPWGSVVGPETACRVIADELLGDTRPRVHRRQAFLAVRRGEDLGTVAPDLRPATPADVPEMVPLIARYRVDDGLALTEDENRVWVRAHTEDRTRRGALFVVQREGRIVFVGAFNFRGTTGAGLGGIYTAPDARGLGIGATATAALARLALQTGPVCTLHVAEQNVPALRCYTRAGFREHGQFRLTFR